MFANAPILQITRFVEIFEQVWRTREFLFPHVFELVFNVAQQSARLLVIIDEIKNLNSENNNRFE